MKTASLLFALMALFLGACAIDHPANTAIDRPVNPIVEDSSNLGYGFRRVTLAEPSRSAFESVGHFDYLYYHNLRLGRWGKFSLSPTGQYAIYQDGGSGKMYLFHTADRKITPLKNNFTSFPDSLQWHEAPGTVELRVTTGGETNKIEIH